MMRKQFMRKDLTLIVTRTNRVYVLYSGIIVLINFSFIFLCLPLSLSLLLSSLTHLSSSPHLTQAALMGGTTMVMAMVLPEQHCSLLDAYENCRALADAKACCDYALHVGVTWWGPKVRAKEGST